MNLLGKLDWSAVPFDQPIVMVAVGSVILAGVFILGWITLKGHWPYLWREWITSVDHKRIGVMYCVLPLSELQFSPGVGVDYYLWALQISGVGTLMTGINFVATILKTRAPGMSLTRMPVFCWTALASNLLIVAAFPVLTATMAMLLLDRYLGFHFFTTDLGGNAMMVVNLIWVWGHPEVYILILPAFGIFSEVIATFSGKPLRSE